MRMLGLLAVANTLAISGGIPPIEQVKPDQWDDEPCSKSKETPLQRADRRAEETIITAENKHEFMRYIKADEKRARKAAKRIKEI